MSTFRRVLKWLLAIVASLIALYAIIGFFVVSKIAHTKVEEIASESLGLPVSLGSVKLNPFTFRLAVDEVRVGNEGAEFFSSEGLVINVSALGYLTHRHYELDELTIKTPKGSLIIAQDGSTNLPSFGDKEAAPKEPKKESSKELPAIHIDSFAIENGEFLFEDHRLSPAFKRHITPIDLHLSDFNTKDEEGNLALSAIADAGEELQVICDVKSIEPVHISNEISLSGITTDGHRPFIQPHIKAKIHSGSLALKATVDCELTDSASPPKISVSDGSISLFDLLLHQSDSEESLINIPEFSLNGIAADVLERKATVENILLREADVTIERAADGTLNIVEQFLPDAEKSEETKTPPEDNTPKEPDAADNSWAVTVDELQLENCKAHYSDEDLELAIPLGINLTINNFTSTLDQPSEIDLTITAPDDFETTLKGSATLKPLDITATVGIQQLTPNLAPALIARYLDVEEFTGAINTSAEVSYKQGAEDTSFFELKEGALNLSGIRLKQSDQPALVDIPSLTATGITVSQKDLIAKVAAIELASGSTIVHRDEAGTVNFQKLVKKPEPKEGEADSVSSEPSADEIQSPSWNVQLGSLKITEHQLRYIDEGDLALDLPVSLDLEVKNFDLAKNSLDAAGSLGVHSAKLDFATNIVTAPLSISGNAELASVKPGEFLDIIQQFTTITTAEGEIGMAANFSYSDGLAVVDEGALNVSELEFKANEEEPFFKVAKIELSEVALDQTQSELSIGTIAIEEPFFGVRKNEEGMININNLLLASEELSGEEEGSGPATSSEEAAPKEEGSPLQIQLGEATITKALFHYTETDIVDLPIQFDLSVGGVSSKGGSGKVEFTSKLLGDGDEKLDIATSFDLKTGDGKGNIDIKGIDFGIAEPWLPELPFDITARGIDYKGSIEFANLLAGAPEFDTEGQLALTNFALSEKSAEPFISCGDVDFGNFSYRFPSNEAVLESLTLSDLDVEIEVAENGELNLTRAFAGESQPKDDEPKEDAVGDLEEKEESGGFELELGKFVITSSRIGFTDRAIQPNVAKALEDFELEVLDVVVGEETRAKFDLTGSIDHHAPIQLNGFYDDRISERFPEWHLIVKNVPVDDFAPYTRKFFGRDIETGAMSLKQDIDLTSDKLEGELKFFFAKLKVGEVVESPDLIDIPFGAALFVLSRNGRIDEEIKFSGDPNDPSFHFGPVFANALGNVVRKIALMPAGIVTRVAQGITGLFQNRGKEWIVGHFEFPDGSAELTPEIRAQLDQIAVPPLIAESYDDLRVAMPDEIERAQMDKLAGQRVSAIRNYLMKRHNLDPHRVLGMRPGAFPGRQPKEVTTDTDQYIFWIERLDTYKAGSESSAQ